MHIISVTSAFLRKNSGGHSNLHKKILLLASIHPTNPNLATKSSIDNRPRPSTIQKAEETSVEHQSINAPSNHHHHPTNLHSMSRPPPRPTPPNRYPRPLPRLLPAPLHPRSLRRNLLPSLLGRPPSLCNPLRPPPRPRPPRRLQRESNRVRLLAARKSVLLACRSSAAAGGVREVCGEVEWGWRRCGLC